MIVTGEAGLKPRPTINTVRRAGLQPRLIAIAIAFASIHAVAQKPPAPVGKQGRAWFEEVAERSGVRFTHRSGHRDKFYLPEIMGGGAALFDMDGDCTHRRPLQHAEKR